MCEVELVDFTLNSPPFNDEGDRHALIKTITLSYKKPTQENAIDFLLDHKGVFDKMKSIKPGDEVLLPTKELKLRAGVYTKLDDCVKVLLPFKLKEYAHPDVTILNKEYKCGFDCYFYSNYFQKQTAEDVFEETR